MGKYKQITKRELTLSMVNSAIFLLVYWVFFYELSTLCKFGRYKNNVAILLACSVFLVAWFIVLLIRIGKRKADSGDEYNFYSRFKIIWTCIAAVIIVLITGFYGTKIYHSAINYNGKLSWFINDMKNKRIVKLEHDNIYNSGIEGLFTDINEKIHMPEKLYIANSFSLNFDSDGKIASFDTFLYGKNDKGETKSYLISYDSKKSEYITIYLNGYANPSYNEDKLLEPLFKTMKAIPLKKTVSSWPEKHYGILYSGKRSFGYNAEGIVNIDSEGNTNPTVSGNSEIIGYTVSVYVPGKENEYTPVRYNLIDGLNNFKSAEPSQDNEKSSNQSNNTEDQFYRSKQVGYRLVVTAAAAGSRSYSLTGTTDGGLTWKTINEDPFAGELGTAAGITFLNDKLGFLCLANNGGRQGQLYRTDDGGVSYKEVKFPEVKVALNSSETYNPFDLPEMPYEKDGSLYVLVGQGADGDYNAGSKALYQSKDNGVTWVYVKEVSNN